MCSTVSGQGAVVSWHLLGNSRLGRVFFNLQIVLPFLVFMLSFDRCDSLGNKVNVFPKMWNYSLKLCITTSS